MIEACEDCVSQMFSLRADEHDNKGTVFRSKIIFVYCTLVSKK